jgi:heme/copper-type cytochrome/quinol oxidase subunit 2
LRNLNPNIIVLLADIIIFGVIMLSLILLAIRKSGKTEEQVRKEMKFRTKVSTFTTIVFWIIFILSLFGMFGSAN